MGYWISSADLVLLDVTDPARHCLGGWIDSSVKSKRFTPPAMRSEVKESTTGHKS